MPINQYFDQSTPSYTLRYLDRIHVTRLDTDKEIELSPHAANIRDTMRKEFIEENKNRDKYWEIITT